MKYHCLLSALLLTQLSMAQNLQFHYDFRHTVDPEHNAKNYPGFSFEYFRLLDTVGTGSFLLKAQADLKGRNNNMGQAFLQISQTLRFWKPKIYLNLHYSGGLGVTDNAFGFYLVNAYGIGASYPFQWKGAWLSINLMARYSAFDKPSVDPHWTAYFGRGFFNYKLFVTGSFVFWTENRNHGDDLTKDLKGKKFAFFGDPQVWFKIKRGLSFGSRINVLYHLVASDNTIQLYPTLGFKYEL